jgi:DNA-binding XRE family transcriptional regulator
MTRRPASGTFARPVASSAPAFLAEPTSSPASSCSVHPNTIGTAPGLAKCKTPQRVSVQCGAGDLFRAARESLGWSQETAGRKYGACRLTIISWEQERTEMPARALLWIQRMAEAARSTGT